MKIDAFASVLLGLFSLWLAALAAMAYSTYGVPGEPVARALFFLLFAVLGLNLLMATVLRRWKTNYTLALFIAGACLLALELALWGAGIGPVYPRAPGVAERDRAKRVRLAGEAGVPFDTRDKEEVLRQLAESGVEAYPAFSEVDDGHLATFASISARLAVAENEGGEYSTYLADEHGFNNPAGLHRPGIAAVLVGGSFANGCCLSQGQDIAGQLRASGLSTLNLGIRGGGPLGKLAVLREYAAPLCPPLVILDLSERMDLLLLTQELRTPLLPRYLAEPEFSQSLVQRQGEVDAALRQRMERELGTAREAEKIGSPLLNALRLRNLRTLVKQAVVAVRLRGQAASPPLEELRRTLAACRQEVEGWGGRLVVLYLPAADTYAGQPGQAGPNHREETLALCAQLGLPVIDHTEAVKAHPDPLSLFPFRINEFGHFNQEGYALVAQSILSGLRKLDGPVGVRTESTGTQDSTKTQ